MFSEKILNIIKNNKEIQNFLTNVDDFEILLKKVDLLEINRINLEYPNFINLKTIEKISDWKEEKSAIILCLTFVRQDYNFENYNIIKIRLYIDQINEKILRILES